MKRRILAGLVAALIVVTFTGCASETTEKKVTTRESSIAANDEKYSGLEGSWSRNMSLKELKDKFNGLLDKVDEKTRFYGLEYTKELDVVKEEKTEYIKESYLYLDQEKPEKNRLESLYFGLKVYGTSEESGQVIMKTSLNFDGEEALKTNQVKFEDTSLAAYAEIFTGVSGRDYKDINKKILEVLKSESGEGVITQSIDGLYEEFTITKDYIVYTLETKEFDFSQVDEMTN